MRRHPLSARTAWTVAALTLAGCGDDGPGETDAGVDTGGDASPGDGAAGSDSSRADGGDAATDGARPPPTELSECDGAPPEWIFCTGFEEPDFSAWDDYDGNPAPTNERLADPGAFGLSGNHVARLRVPPGRGGADFVKVLPRTAPRIHARWYVMWEPGYDFTAANHGSGLHAGSRDLLGMSGNRPSGSDWFTAWVEPVMVDAAPRLNLYAYYAGMYMDCADPAGSCWGDHFPCMVGDSYCTRPEHAPPPLPAALETGRWYCIEEMVDGGTPTSGATGAGGTLDLWLDGTELGPWPARWLRADAALEPTILWLSLFHHDDHSVEGLLLDDVVVSTEPIGCR